MKKYLILAVLALSTTAAYADIPMPNPSEQPETVVSASISEEAAKALWESINSPMIFGSSLRTVSWNYKVLRSLDDTAQVVCTMKTVRNFQNLPTPKPGTTYDCTTTRSLNKAPLPVFKPVRVMG